MRHRTVADVERVTGSRGQQPLHEFAYRLLAHRSEAFVHHDRDWSQAVGARVECDRFHHCDHLQRTAEVRCEQPGQARRACGATGTLVRQQDGAKAAEW